MTSLLLIAALAAPEPGTTLRVTPMAAPSPALKYLLLPEVREQNPGNSTQWYIRCFMEQRNFFFSKEGNNQRKNYLQMSLAELAKEPLENYGGSALTQADWGARLEFQDWDMLRKLRDEGSDLRLPELTAFRVLGVSLQVRFRGAVARGDWDTAITTAKTMFAFAKHLGEHPTLAGNLLGLEVANLALNTLEEMIQQPTAPNLYWAYAELPKTLVELRRGFQGERFIIDQELAAIHSDAVMTDAELEAFVSKLSGRIGAVREQAGRPPKNVRAVIAELVKDGERLAGIRNRLLKDVLPSGIAEKVSALKVLGFPPLQLVLLEERRLFEKRRDEQLKLLSFSPSQIAAFLTKMSPGPHGLFDDFLPGVYEHRRTQARMEQRLALFQYVEAIRLHAAQHDGKLPESIADLALPVPVDPVTGKAFSYTRDNDTATLSGDGRSYTIRLAARDKQGAGR